MDVFNKLQESSINLPFSDSIREQLGRVVYSKCGYVDVGEKWDGMASCLVRLFLWSKKVC